MTVKHPITLSENVSETVTKETQQVTLVSVRLHGVIRRFSKLIQRVDGEAYPP